MHGTHCWKWQFFNIGVKYVYCVSENRSTVYASDVAHGYIRTATCMYCVPQAHMQSTSLKCGLYIEMPRIKRSIRLCVIPLCIGNTYAKHSSICADLIVAGNVRPVCVCHATKHYKTTAQVNAEYT
jgi:hypothetical protein